MIKRLLFLSLSFILTALYSSAFGQIGWFWQNPLPQGNTLNKASWVDASTVYVSGAGGTLMKSTNAGVNFSIINTGLQENLSVDFINETTGFSISGSGILRTLDGGLSWQYYVITTDYDIKQFYSNGNSFYVIARQFINTGPEVSRIYKSTDLGQTWNINMEPDTNTYFNALDFTDQFTGYAVGRKRFILPAQTRSRIYRTTNAGNLWDSVSTGFMWELTGISCVNPNSIYLTARGNSSRSLIVKTTNGCASFDTLYSALSHELVSIKFFNNNEGYASSFYHFVTTTNSGVTWNAVQQKVILGNINSGLSLRENFIYLTSNSGMNWQSITQGFQNPYLLDVHFINGSTGFIAGYGRIYKTTSGGTNWREDTLTSPDFVENIQFVNGLTGYAGMDGRKVAKTTDGGESWIIYNTGLGDHNHGMSFPSPDTGYAITKNGMQLKTTNGGLNWVHLRSDYDSGYDIYFINNNLGFSCAFSIATGKGTVNKTSNGGLNWVRTEIDSTYSLYDTFAPSEYLWFAGGRANNNRGVICRSTNSGLTWTVTNIPNVVYSVHFPSVNTGYATTESYAIYKTTNSGANWFPTSSINGASYGGIYFVNENTGWAVSLDSRVIKTTTGGGGLIGIEPVSNEIPRAFELGQNYPNPFNPTTNIEFRIARSGLVNLTIYDILGREVQTIVNENLSPGVYKITWNASNLPSGIYFYRLKTGDFSQSKKMILIK